MKASWIAALLLLPVACAPSIAPSAAPERRSYGAPDPSSTLSPAPVRRPPLAGPLPAPRPSATPQPRIAPTASFPDPDRTVWPRMMDRFQTKVEIPETEQAGTVIGFHLDPRRVTFRVRYTPGEAKFISEWAGDLIRRGERPLLVFPAGFFTSDNFALGLLVADGDRYGDSIGVGGVFAVQDGQPEIRWLDPQPVAPAERFDQAVEAWPAYVSRGAITPLNEHESRAARTVIVETRSGDFFWLISPTDLFRTVDLARWLIDSDLDVYNALNLDGGRSAGYWAGDDDFMDSHVALPAVIAVYAR
ncbi:MAG: phosphodiester glycosidase family protein [Chloroflexi bacterium]|nr:phosphodiester glycosidase family protein [Chloroflexota bacterium]